MPKIFLVRAGTLYAYLPTVVSLTYRGKNTIVRCEDLRVSWDLKTLLTTLVCEMWNVETERFGKFKT